jgi:DNA-binding response OmpR family regulator
MTRDARQFEIVVAEDNLADLMLVREALKAHSVDCTLQVFRDGQQAVEFIDDLDADPRATIDLMILDMHLPKCDGREILTRLRSSKHHAHTPVVLMTGLDSHALGLNDAGQGAVMYFPKPSSLDEFLELGSLVRRVLDKGRAVEGAA